MKKVSFFLFAIILLFAACSEDGDNNVSEEAMDEEEVKEIIENSGIGEGDELTSLSIEEGEINAVISLGPSDPIRPEDLAVSRYSSISDDLLPHEGWEVLTVEFADVGTISINRNESLSNELGVFFPVQLIEEKLDGMTEVDKD